MTKAKRKPRRAKNPKQAPATQRRAAATRPEHKPIPDADPAVTPAEKPEAVESDAGMPPDHQRGAHARGRTPDQEVEERARESNPPLNPDDAQR